MRTALAIFALLLAGCSVPAPAPQSARVMPMPAMVEAPTAPPVGETVPLIWDPSETPGVTYRLVQSNLLFTNVVETASSSIVLSNIILPQTFMVIATDGQEDSDRSNILKVTGKDDVLTVYVLTNSAAGRDDWQRAATVFTGTNVTGDGFWWLRADHHNQFRTESTE